MGRIWVLVSEEHIGVKEIIISLFFLHERGCRLRPCISTIYEVH
jgi:hypothetical protein